MADRPSTCPDPATVERRRKNNEKQHRFRTRARRGERLARFVVTPDLVAHLVRHGYLPDRDDFDLPAIEDAHGRMLADLVSGMHKRYSV